jgi:hypothetical protein
MVELINDDIDLVELNTVYAALVNPQCHYDLHFMTRTIDDYVKLLDDIDAVYSLLEERIGT